MSKTASLLIGLALIIVVGGFVSWQTGGTDRGTARASAGSETANTGNTQTNEPITAEAIAQHNNRSSCWSSINGGVYDLTAWIPRHPGGEQAILQLCGTDGSAKFNRQHGGATLQAQILAGFKIGTLAQ